MSHVKSFKPLIDNTSRVLILGSMPGVQSLKFQQYYAHPQNHFWWIMFALFNEFPESDYERKLAFIQRKRIALWDSRSRAIGQAVQIRILPMRKQTTLSGFLELIRTSRLSFSTEISPAKHSERM